VGQIVRALGKRYFDNSQCTLNSEASDDFQLQWIEMLSSVGMQAKKALQKYVEALL